MMGWVVIGGIAAIISTIYVVDWCIAAYVKTHTAGQPFFGCKLGFHPWEVHHVEASNVSDLPPYGGIRDRHLTMHGEATMRTCLCCDKVQVLHLDYEGCFSTSEAPDRIWVNVAVSPSFTTHQDGLQ